MTEKHDHTTKVSGVWDVNEIKTPKPKSKRHFEWAQFIFGVVLGFVLGAMFILALMA